MQVQFDGLHGADTDQSGWQTVYQERQSSDRKQVEQAYIKRRETGLAQLGAIERSNRKGVTISHILEQNLDEYEKNWLLAGTPACSSYSPDSPPIVLAQCILRGACGCFSSSGFQLSQCW